MSGLFWIVSSRDISVTVLEALTRENRQQGVIEIVTRGHAVMAEGLAVDVTCCWGCTIRHSI